MTKILRRINYLHIVFYIVAFAFFGMAVIRAATSYQVNTGSVPAVTEFGVCKVITNSSGKNLFIPTNTSGEWSAFYNNPPTGVAVATCDTTPDSFNFSDQTSINLSTGVSSNILQITGINTSAATSISGNGGQYRICNDSSCSSVVVNWTISGSSITNNQYIQLSQTSSGSFSTQLSTTFTVGGGSDIWYVTTRAGNSCSLPWGGSIGHGASVTVYQASSVNYPSSCVSETRTCNDGSLLGSYTNTSCTVVQPIITYSGASSGSQNLASGPLNLTTQGSYTLTINISYSATVKGVAGGGGGRTGWRGGGGGASNTDGVGVTLNPGTTYAAEVGAGGSANTSGGMTEFRISGSTIYLQLTGGLEGGAGGTGGSAAIGGGQNGGTGGISGYTDQNTLQGTNGVGGASGGPGGGGGGGGLDERVPVQEGGYGGSGGSGGDQGGGSGGTSGGAGGSASGSGGAGGCYVCGSGGGGGGGKLLGGGYRGGGGGAGGSSGASGSGGQGALVIQ